MLSGNSGASRFGSNSQACTRSFQRDIALSTFCTPLVVGELAAREQRQRAERQAVPQEQAPLDAGEQGALRDSASLLSMAHELLHALP